MGRRYQAILTKLGVPYLCKDRETKETDLISLLEDDKDIDHVILTTPTDTHYNLLKLLKNWPDLRILCEKPISKNLNELIEIGEWKLDITMMYQYKYVETEENPDARGCHYVYYNHGSDGLVWDNIQLVGLAEDYLYLRENSPVWDMNINGKKVKRESVDNAYVKFVDAWLCEEEVQEIDALVDLHIKAARLQQKVTYNGKYHSLDLDTGADGKLATP